MENTNISEKHRQELLQLCEQVRASGTILLFDIDNRIGNFYAN